MLKNTVEYTWLHVFTRKNQYNPENERTNGQILICAHEQQGALRNKTRAGPKIVGDFLQGLQFYKGNKSIF